MSKLSDIEGILEELISFDTTSSVSNLECLDWIDNYLQKHNIKSKRIWSEDRSKANLWATIGPKNERGYILSGHMDTVSTIHQEWKQNPYKLSCDKTRFIGRGVTDMKGFLAIVLSLVPLMQKRVLLRPIHLAFSYDEEIGCIGVRGILKHLSRVKVKPIGCFVGEPSQMKPIIGHKGSVRYWVDVVGKSAHSSLVPKAVNAIEYASRVIVKVHNKEKQIETNGRRDYNYDIPHTTLQVGVMNGGKIPNIVPSKARFTFEVRAIDQDDPIEIAEEIVTWAKKNLVPEMKTIYKMSDINFVRSSFVPGFDLPLDHELVKLTQKLSGSSELSKVSYGTEAGLYTKVGGIPTIVIGPGNIEQAHEADEYIEISQIEKCHKFLKNLIETCAEH